MHLSILTALLATTGAQARDLLSISVGVSKADSAAAWCSSADSKYALSSFDAPALDGDNSAGLDTWELAIKEKTGRKQTVKGFGAAITDSTVAAFGKLPGRVREELLRDLMTPEGVNFQLVRHTVGSSDLSGDPAYSYDDNNGEVDTDFASFNLGDRGTAMAKLLAEMRRLQPGLAIVGSPWAPPGWMQLDGVLTGTTEQNNLNHSFVDAYAQYFVRYLQAYEELGAHVDAITLQNEPLNSRAEMPTMYIYADEAGALIRDHVGPALAEAGLDTKIWSFDHNTGDYSYPKTVQEMASDYVSAVAWHCYSGNDPANWTPLTTFHGEFAGVEQYMTECWTSKTQTDWRHSSSFALLPLQNWANGIVAWALATYTDGGPYLSGGDACATCTGLVTVDPDKGTYTKEVDYYMLGQFSRFMPKGAVVLHGTGSYLYPDASGIEHVASLNPDGTRTVVIQNRYDHDIFVKLETESEDKTWNGRVYAESVVTWVLPAV